MMKITWLILLVVTLFSMSLISFAQTPVQTPNPRIEAQRQAAEMRKRQREYEQQILNSNKDYPREKSRAEQKADCSMCTSPGGEGFKYPNEEELAVVAPDADFAKEFETFLSKEGTGLTRLISDTGCGADSRILIVNDDCQKFERIPGYGSSFSFRQDKYILGRFADVVVKEGTIYLFGNATIGLITKLGDVPVEGVTAETKGARYVFSFAPKTKSSEVQAQNDDLVNGITANGFEYNKSARLVKGQTYLLRSVAYKVKSIKVENRNYIEFDNTLMDKRRDVIVALRVLEIGGDGSATFLWKILKNKKAPKLELKGN